MDENPITKLQTAREKLGLTRAQLAVRARVSERSIFNHETRVGGKAGVNTQRAIALAVRSKPARLFSIRGEAL